MAQQHTALRIPETMNAQQIGAYMGGLREHFKLTQQDVSERLHIRPRYVMAIEEGKFEQLPGKVYARGYVHTYAEFLGLDADQVVDQCFGQGAALASPQATVVAAPSARRELSKTNWRGIGIAGVAALLALLLFTQLTGGNDAVEEQPASTVTEVPDSMLQSVRTAVMPTAQNYECLTSNVALACFFADNAMQHIMQLERGDRILFADDVADAADEKTDADKPTKSDDE